MHAIDKEIGSMQEFSEKAINNMTLIKQKTNTVRSIVSSNYATY